MGVKPTAPRVMSGTHGTLFWDGEPVYEASSASATVKPDREDVQFASGDMWKDSKIVALGGEYSVKIKKIFSRAKALAEAYHKGLDPRSELIFKLDDPDAYGAERVAIHNCWFNDLQLTAFETGKITEEEYSGGFTGFHFLDSVEVR